MREEEACLVRLNEVLEAAFVHMGSGPRRVVSDRTLGRIQTPLTVASTRRYTTAMKPEPAPVDTSKLVELAQSTMARSPFPMLASVDHMRPRLRPVSPVGVDGFTVYVASLRSSHKTRELAENPAVELCYLDDGHDQVRIEGTAELVRDDATRRDVWNRNPLLRNFLVSIENPEFMLYRIRPERVRFMREWALRYHEVPLA